MKINILLFNDFETLDVFGPVEILARIPDHDLNYYSIDGGIVKSAQNTEIMTDPINKADKTGVLIIPGGKGTRRYVLDDMFINTIKYYAQNSKYCLTICTGSALLAKTGLLDNKRATSNKKAFEWVKTTSAKTEWINNARWIVDGKYYTSSGVSAGMDMALGFIGDIYGIERSEQIANDIEYIWNRNDSMDYF